MFLDWRHEQSFGFCVFFFWDLIEMDYMGGDYFICFFKDEDDSFESVRFVNLHMGKEYDDREFTEFVPILIMCGKKRKYIIEVDNNISFQYVFGFARRG